MNWFKKAFGVAVAIGGTTAFGCSGTNQLIGSDGLTVAGANNGAGSSGSGDGAGGSRVGGASSASEPTYELWQVAAAPRLDDDRPYLCLPEELPVDATGNADCYVLSARQNADCSCAGAGLSPANAERTRTARLQSKLIGLCDSSGKGACADLCVCEVDRAVGTSLQQCQTEAEPDASTTGWCYVSAAAGTAQGTLLEACPSNQQQRMRFFGPVTEQKKEYIESDLLFLGCPFVRRAAPVGDPCISDDEYRLNFPGYSVKEVSINDNASMCESGICIQNHFQGRASCPDGQALGGGDCLAAGSYNSVTVPVAPQLEARPARQTSICSCQCAGPGPGPYCTCSESMQCQHLIDDLKLGGGHLAGSYCIPKGTQYEPDASP